MLRLEEEYDRDLLRLEEEYDRDLLLLCLLSPRPREPEELADDLDRARRFLFFVLDSSAGDAERDGRFLRSEEALRDLDLERESDLLLPEPRELERDLSLRLRLRL